MSTAYAARCNPPDVGDGLHYEQGPMCPYPEGGCSNCDTRQNRLAGGRPARGVDLRKDGQPWSYGGPGWPVVDDEDWWAERCALHESYLDSVTP